MFPEHEKSITDILMCLDTQKHKTSPKANIGSLESQAVATGPQLSVVHHSPGSIRTGPRCPSLGTGSLCNMLVISLRDLRDCIAGR